MYDNQIEKIEEQMDAEQEHHDAQMAQIDELEEHGVITKEEAEEVLLPKFGPAHS